MAELVTRREFARLERCDEKQVRRALERGLLVATTEGKLDTAQVGSGWRKPRVDSKDSPASQGADISADTANVRTRMSASAGTSAGTAGQIEQGPASSPEAATSLKRAVAHKEDYAGRLKELEYRHKAGELVELEVARQVLFTEFRAARDAWLNWPTRYAALIAAELGIEEADRLAEVLTSYVHKQLQSLGTPRGEFRR